MCRNLVDVYCAIAIVVIAIFLMLKSDPRLPTRVEVRPTWVERWKYTGAIGLLQIFCLALGVVKLVRWPTSTSRAQGRSS